MMVIHSLPAGWYPLPAWRGGLGLLVIVGEWPYKPFLCLACMSELRRIAKYETHRMLTAGIVA